MSNVKSITENKNNGQELGFFGLVEKFNEVATKSTQSQEFAEILEKLSQACVFSVLKKILDKTGDPTVDRLRLKLSRDINLLEFEKRYTENATIKYLNTNGDIIEKSNPDYKSFNKTKKTLSESYDLCIAATIAILENVNRQKSAGETVNLNKPYFKRELSREIWILQPESENAFVEVETTPITDIFRAIRKAIRDSKSARVDISRFCYIDDAIKDAETESVHRYYRRIAGDMNLGSYAKNSNGSPTVYTVDNKTMELYDFIVKNANYTKMQFLVFKLMLKGYSGPDIADYLQISNNSVKSAIREIRRKTAALLDMKY